MDAVRQRLATSAVKTMAHRGIEMDSLPTPHPISPGESMLCKYMIVVWCNEYNYCSLSARNDQLFH